MKVHLHVDLQNTQEVTTAGYRLGEYPHAESHQARDMRSVAMTNMRRHNSSKKQSWGKASWTLPLKHMPHAAEQRWEAISKKLTYPP